MGTLPSSGCEVKRAALLARPAKLTYYAAGLLAGVETNPLVEPIMPIPRGLLIESVSRFIPADRPGLPRGRVQILRIGHGHQVVQPSALHQQRSGRRVRNESNRLYRCHGPEPVGTCCTGQPRHEVQIFRTCEVRDEPAVSYHEHRGFDAPLDADEQRTHRSAVTYAKVGYALIVDVGPCAQNIDGTLQILDQLDLLGPVLGAESDGRSTAASKRGIDRNRYCAVLGE